MTRGRRSNPRYTDEDEPANRAARRYAQFGDARVATYASSGPSEKALERARRKAVA